MRKIIHIDMDCFYAAIEERDDPSLRGKPVAVGGGAGGGTRRGVLCTANYEARKFGCRSAMPIFKAMQLCPQLKLLPVRMKKYSGESARIRSIFGRFTDLIEPLSLDEAYLDVSHLQSNGSAVAREIRAQIAEETGLSASAGISVNKLLAKIASDWNKPNGQFEVKADEVEDFIAKLPVGKLWGVGGKMRAKLSELGIETCGELRQLDRIEMARRFGKWGLELWHLCRGEDDRAVEPIHVRKSVSSETTFPYDIQDLPGLSPPMESMIAEVAEELATRHSERGIRALVVKLKFADFTQTTAERTSKTIDLTIFRALLEEAWKRGNHKAVRLLGVGVRLTEPGERQQLELF